MTVQFDTGSAIVYVLTDKCTKNCNSETKFKDKSPPVPSTAMERVRARMNGLNTDMERAT